MINDIERSNHMKLKEKYLNAYYNLKNVIKDYFETYCAENALREQINKYVVNKPLKNFIFNKIDDILTDVNPYSLSRDSFAAYNNDNLLIFKINFIYNDNLIIIKIKDAKLDRTITIDEENHTTRINIKSIENNEYYEREYNFENDILTDYCISEHEITTKKIVSNNTNISLVDFTEDKIDMLNNNSLSKKMVK